MAWDVVDYTVFGALLLGVGLIYRLARRNVNNTAYRFAVGVALAATFILIWVNGAVGIIGDESNDANMMFFGVLAVGIIGAIRARFQPLRMVRALWLLSARLFRKAAQASISAGAESEG